MKLLTAEDLLSIQDFRAARPAWEREVLAARRSRRLALGPHMSLLFENRLSMWWQVQEMCRVEHITAPEAVAHELETYNALIPGPSELSATLLIEVEAPEARTKLLRDLAGLHEHLWLIIGERAPLVADFDDEQFDRERVSAVQFVRFRLDPEALRAFFDLGQPARVRVDHAAYTVEVPLGPAVRGALVEDLSA